MKFADDTKMVGKNSNDEDALYNKQIENFVNRCDRNYLYLNVCKTFYTAVALKFDQGHWKWYMNVSQKVNK